MAASTVGLADLDRWIRDYAERIQENKELLTELDSAIGDADHGANMDRGLRAAVAALDKAAAEGHPPASADALLKAVGMALVSSVGGASGPLYGTFFLRMAAAARGLDELAPDAFAAALRSGLDGVASRGKAVAGDKTIIDALEPACASLEAAVAGGAGLRASLEAAATAADAGRDATTPMLARKGRASYLGERSIGHQDPGATSIALLVASAAATLG